ncbi:MAG: acyl-CoA dehydratase activase [Thermodesulfobacteriota bacterium]
MSAESSSHQRGPDSPGQRFWAGVDVGACTTKVAVIDAEARLRAYQIQRSGVDYTSGSAQCFERALQRAGIPWDAVELTVATGYGRYNVKVAGQVRTEISCHMKGCYFHYPHAATIVDIGGQDCKVIRVDDSGRRVAFKMNRKCAAGTGAFLEEIALRLSLDISELDSLARRSTRRVRIGAYCTVFTSTEILTLIRRGEKVEDIVRGVFDSVVERILEMDPLEGIVVLTGGVVEHNPILAEVLSQRIRGKVLVPPHPQLTGALGAALYALEKAGGGQRVFGGSRISQG